MLPVGGLSSMPACSPSRKKVMSVFPVGLTKVLASMQKT